MDFQKKSTYILLAVLFVYVVLVGSHGGEFWPFNSFPTYSQAGKPWTKTLVRDVTNVPNTMRWKEVSHLSYLPGEPVALNNIGISQTDLSSLVIKTEKWDADRISALRSFFSQPLIQHKLLIYKVSGSISDDSLNILGTPFIFLSPDTTIFVSPKKKLIPFNNL